MHSKVRRRDLDAEQHSCRGINVGSGADKRDRLSPTPRPHGPLQVHALHHIPNHGGSVLQARNVVRQDTERMGNGEMGSPQPTNREDQVLMLLESRVG